jgi:hypothetical protein
MNVLNWLMGVIAALLSNVLVGASPAVLHVASLVALALIAIGVLIALPELFLLGLVAVVLLYLAGLLK